MKFSEFIVRDAILVEFDADDGKEAIIRRMCEALVDAGALAEDQLEDVVRAIVRREEEGSTGIGHGVAVPHTKHASLDRLIATIAVSPQGVDFEALDGEKVHALFLVISPLDQPGLHLRALEYITRQLHHDRFSRFLKTAKSADEVWQLLEEADQGKFAA